MELYLAAAARFFALARVSPPPARSSAAARPALRGEEARGELPRPAVGLPVHPWRGKAELRLAGDVALREPPDGWMVGARSGGRAPEVANVTVEEVGPP